MRTQRKQSGVVLVVALVLLLVLTLMSVTSMRSAILEERMTGNTQNLQIAFQFGEAALREGEALLSQPTLPGFNNTNGLYVFQPPTSNSFVPRWEDDTTVWRSANVSGDAATGLAGAEYIIEQMAVTNGVGGGDDDGSLGSDTEITNNTVTVYRITARAWGPTADEDPEPMIVLQSTFQR
jgi:type IV pilus assembly protein PilX